jgi:uncharacterized membrane protein YqiK
VSAAAQADATRLGAEAEATATRVRGEAAADTERARGSAAAVSYRAGIEALGEASYTAMQLASILGSAGLKLVPDVVLGEGRSSLADVLLAKMAGIPSATTVVRDTATPTNGAPKVS